VFWPASAAALWALAGGGSFDTTFRFADAPCSCDDGDACNGVETCNAVGA
jgi:hypothetical protein